MKYFSSNGDVAWKSALLTLKLHLLVLRPIDIQADADISKRSNHLVRVIAHGVPGSPKENFPKKVD